MILVEITDERRKRIARIIRATDCKRAHECWTSELAKLSRIEMFAGSEVISCLEGRAKDCRFGSHYGDAIFCGCLVRAYIAKIFQR